MTLGYLTKLLDSNANRAQAHQTSHDLKEPCIHRLNHAERVINACKSSFNIHESLLGELPKLHWTTFVTKILGCRGGSPEFKKKVSSGNRALLSTLGSVRLVEVPREVWLRVAAVVDGAAATGGN